MHPLAPDRDRAASGLRLYTEPDDQPFAHYYVMRDRRDVIPTQMTDVPVGSVVMLPRGEYTFIFPGNATVQYFNAFPVTVTETGAYRVVARKAIVLGPTNGAVRAPASVLLQPTNPEPPGPSFPADPTSDYGLVPPGAAWRYRFLNTRSRVESFSPNLTLTDEGLAAEVGWTPIFRCVTFAAGYGPDTPVGSSSWRLVNRLAFPADYPEGLVRYGLNIRIGPTANSGSIVWTYGSVLTNGLIIDYTIPAQRMAAWESQQFTVEYNFSTINYASLISGAFPPGWTLAILVNGAGQVWMGSTGVGYDDGSTIPLHLSAGQYALINQAGTYVPVRIGILEYRFP